VSEVKVYGIMMNQLTLRYESSLLFASIRDSTAARSSDSCGSGSINGGMVI
jgi:hypothetical protein